MNATPLAMTVLGCGPGFDMFLPSAATLLKFAGTITLYLTLLATPVALNRHERRRKLRRIAHGQCRHCGYDVRFSPSGRCPECGTPHSAMIARS